jgi:hypothetical protein
VSQRLTVRVVVPRVRAAALPHDAPGHARRRTPDGGCEDSPFWRLRVPSHAAAAAIARRSVLVRVMLDVWGEGETLDEMIAAVLAYPGTHALACFSAARLSAHTCPVSPCAPAEALRAPFLAAGSTFRVLVDGFGCHHSMAEQREMHARMEPIPFLGKVDLKARACCVCEREGT